MLFPFKWKRDIPMIPCKTWNVIYLLAKALVYSKIDKNPFYRNSKYDKIKIMQKNEVNIHALLYDFFLGIHIDAYANICCRFHDWCSI